jgi:carboxypeptidase C (cathepsin A)
VDQMPIMGDLSRVAVREYPGGHMFYTRPTSRDALRKDVMEMFASMIAPTTTAMVNFVTTTVGWKVNARYNALAHDVNRLWDGGDDLRKGSVDDLLHRADLALVAKHFAEIWLCLESASGTLHELRIKTR